MNDDYYPDKALLSECCGALAMGETFTSDDGTVTGICGQCHVTI